MQRRERHQLARSARTSGVTTTGPESGSAVDDAMADAQDPRSAGFCSRSQPPGHRARRARRAPSRRASRRRGFAAPSLTEKRGAVPIPSICPRLASRQLSPCGRANDAEFRLDEPAFRTRAKSSTVDSIRPLLGAPPRMRDEHRDAATGDARAHAVGAAGQDDRTRAPSTMPALSALARKLSCFARMLPASRSGTSRMSGSPATSDAIPLICAPPC